jgi:hypothetical protein
VTAAEAEAANDPTDAADQSKAAVERTNLKVAASQAKRVKKKEVVATASSASNAATGSASRVKPS